MNRVLMLLVAATLAGTTLAQDPTGNPMYDVQYGANAVHQMYEGTFDNIRFYSSDILNEQNNELLSVALDTIRSWGMVAADQTLPKEARLRKIMTAFSTTAIGEASRQCIDNARSLLQARQLEILKEVELGRVRSSELQYKAIDGLREFNILVDYDQFYDHMTSYIQEYYTYLTTVIYPALEIKVGDLEYNRDTLTISMRGCLMDAAKRHL